jgi:hypothetical protein
MTSDAGRRGGPRSGDGGRRGGASSGRQGTSGGAGQQGRGGQQGGKKGGGGRAGASGGQGRGGGQGGPRNRKPSPTGENETVQQLTGPLEKVLARLPATQRQVLELRMGLKDGHPHDLADTARELGLSLSEARDIEQRAFAHIREAVPLQQLQRFLPKG